MKLKKIFESDYYTINGVRHLTFEGLCKWIENKGFRIESSRFINESTGEVIPLIDACLIPKSKLNGDYKEIFNRRMRIKMTWKNYIDSKIIY